jgi:hypothetical protein
MRIWEVVHKDLGDVNIACKQYGNTQPEPTSEFVGTICTATNGYVNII